MSGPMHWRQNIWTWRWLLAPLGAALYALRVSLEATPSHLLWGAFAALVVLLVGVLLRRTSFSLAPLNLLWAYVPWPAFWPALALGVGVTSAVALLIANLPDGRRAPWVADGLLLTGALALYVGTLAPTILAADGGEFQIVGPVLGVAHPPGFALYTMLAKLFSLLPFGEVAYRVNLTGAVAGALALVVVSRTARDITGSIWAGLAAACALGVSTTFWAQSTTANIRALTILFIALCCSFLVRYLSLPAGSKQGGRALAGFAFSYGLAIAHHAWPAILAPLLVGVALWHDPPLLRQLRRWPRYLAAFVLPFLSDLYIVVRAITGAPFGTADLIDAGRVVDHLIGRGFSGDMFAYLHLNRTLWERFLVVGNILHLQFGLPLLLLAGVGAAWLVWRRPKMAVLLGGVFLIMALIVATYRAPQSVEYLMPAYVPVAVCVGCAGALVRRLALPRASRAVLAAFVFLPAFALGARQLPSYRALHQDRTAREYAESVLLAAPPGAQILSNWHWYTPLRYLQLVEGQRADVDVVYIYPQGATAMPQAWPQQIERALSESDRPLVVTNYYPTYLDLPYRFEPLGEAYLVRAEPRLEMPDGFIPLNARLTEGADAIQLLGVRASGTGGVRPGEQVSVDLAWQPVAPLQRGYAFSVQLIGADGVPRGQRDRWHDAAPSYAPGEVLVDRYQFPVFAAAEPGAYHLLASVYYTGEGGTWRRLTLPDGQDTVSLGTIDLLPAEQAPVSVHPQNQAFLAGPSAATATGDGPAFVGPTLVGVDYDDTLPEGRRVYLHWRGAAQPAVAQLTSGAQLVAQATIPALDPYGDPSTPLGTPVDRRGPGRATAPAQADAPATGRTCYVSIALDVPPGTRDLRLSLVDAQTGRPLARRGPWGLPLRAPLRLPALPAGQHYLPFGGKLALTGFQASSNWEAGKPARVALRFLGLQPIVLDYVVSVRVDGVQAMPGPSDSVPALGAIPTFKWIRGSCVNDVHLLETLPGATGQGQLVVGVYDAFTTEALMPLDERVARLGLAGVPLQSVTIR